MKTKITLILSLICLFSFSQEDSLKKEDSQLENTENNAVIINYFQRKALNPANAGLFEKNNLQTSYQFNIYDAPVTSFLASYDNSFGKKDGWGFGVNYRTENYNNYIQFKHIGINLSKDLRIKKHTTTFGLGAEFLQASFDWSNNPVFGDMIDPRQGVIYPSQDVPRIGNASTISLHFGLTHTYKGFRMGVSALNINQPHLSVIGDGNYYPTELNFNISYAFKIKNVDIIPIYDITRISAQTLQNFHIMGLYQKKYFIAVGAQNILQDKAVFNFQTSAGAFLNNRFQTSISYTITPRYLDYAHVFSVKLAYLFTLKKKAT